MPRANEEALNYPMEFINSHLVLSLNIVFKIGTIFVIFELFHSEQSNKATKTQGSCWVWDNEKEKHWKRTIKEREDVSWPEGKNSKESSKSDREDAVSI